MKTVHSTKREWLEWTKVQRAATLSWVESQDPADAIAMVSRFLGKTRSLEVKREAVAFRGSLSQASGDYSAAIRDFLQAREIAKAWNLESYSIEISLAEIFREVGYLDKEERWTLAALRSAADDPRECGAGALLRLLRLRNNSLKQSEFCLAKKVIFQAWSLLRVEGKPNLDDLVATAEKLFEAQSGPFAANNPPRPQTYHEP